MINVGDDRCPPRGTMLSLQFIAESQKRSGYRRQLDPLIDSQPGGHGVGEQSDERIK